jgi:hypothetical protein
MRMTRTQITPAQCRAARGLVHITPAELSSLAVVPRVVIEGFEGSGIMPNQDDLAALRHALEQKGVVFIEGNGGGAGVRLLE